MRGVCSIKNCISQGTVKISEDFESVAVDCNINICWSCGSKIINALAKEEINHGV